MREKIKKVLQRYGEVNANLNSEYLIEQLTDDLILALGEDSRDIRYQSNKRDLKNLKYQSLGDDVV
tara:strand:- start:758 stop:955 length:198 start_codon:yes stop_codon:yes gene_type:complete